MGLYLVRYEGKLSLMGKKAKAPNAPRLIRLQPSINEPRGTYGSPFRKKRDSPSAGTGQNYQNPSFQLLPQHSPQLLVGSPKAPPLYRWKLSRRTR